MADTGETPLDRLWSEYAIVFRDFDDLMLARWMAQTLGQLEGRFWRLSHPLVGAYRLAAHLAHDRQIWHKRLVGIPAAYIQAPCCRAPLLPLLTRDALESGLICLHCNGSAVPFDELPSELSSIIKPWAQEYGPVHAIAHQDDKERGGHTTEKDMDGAALKAEKLLIELASDIMPKVLDFYPAAIWEDQDECLEVRPEDVFTC